MEKISKAIQSLEGHTKIPTAKRELYISIQRYYEEGDFNQMCRALTGTVNSLASKISKKLVGYDKQKYDYSECQGIVWEVIAKMIDKWWDESSHEIPLVYRLEHKVMRNLLPDLIKMEDSNSLINKPKGKYWKDMTKDEVAELPRFTQVSFDFMLETKGEAFEMEVNASLEYANLYKYSVEDVAIANVDGVEDVPKADDDIVETEFINIIEVDSSNFIDTEKEIFVVMLQSREEDEAGKFSIDISTRELASKLNISQSKASRIMRKLMPLALNCEVRCIEVPKQVCKAS